VVEIVVEGPADLGSQDDVVAAPLERLADDLF
jgi:hypothetical protein